MVRKQWIFSVKTLKINEIRGRSVSGQAIWEVAHGDGTKPANYERYSVMLIGTVSDEQFNALAEIAVELVDKQGRSWATHSTAGGAIRLDCPAGEYEVILNGPGYGPKRSQLLLKAGEPCHFRLVADRLLGYVWPKWVVAGEQAEFRVHSVRQYHLELWRYGLEKERVARLGWYDEHGPRATAQIVPDSDFSQTGVAWNRLGYGSANHQQKVAAPERSGLYYFHARTEAGEQFTFPWIVAPAKPTAPIAVLASNLNWNAYNNFGGRSNYINADRLPDWPIVNSRQELKRYTDPSHHTWGCEDYAPLSFDRPEPMNHIDPAEQPTDPIEGRNGCHQAQAEWRLLAWLEREQMPYDYYAETQLHDGTLDLDRYKVLILSTHPEYWTRAMYRRLKNWVFEQGGRLLYLGGNGLNCEVELLPNQQMICHNGKLKSLWADGIGAESRFALRVESEANLLGVVFTPAGIMTAAPYKVEDGSHWLFRGTNLKTGSVFGTESLHRRCPGGASGHETDKISPEFSPKNLQLLARGMNPDNGGADMVVFDTPSGGKVFSAGSITYPASLLVDPGVSQVTLNALRNFLES